MERAELEAKLKTYVGKTAGPPTPAPDPVNEAMIRHWCEVMGDRLPVYTDADVAAKSAHGGLVAPPTMLQAWILRGVAMASPADEYDDGQLQIGRLLVDAGYPSVVATNCEQEYTRYLRPGDRLVAETVFESISEQKATALGIGYFVDTRTTFRDQHGDEVGWMTFRILRFKPNQPAVAAAPSASAQPAASRVDCGRRSVTTTSGGGTASRPASSASSAARNARRCATRRGRCADSASRSSGTGRSRRARARSTRTS